MRAGNTDSNMREFSKALLVAALALAVAWTTRSPGAPAKRDAFEVPMQFVNGMPAIELMVNGKGPFLFGFETGAQGAARIDASLVEKLGLETVGEMRASDPSGRNPRTLPVVRLASLEIGGLRFADVQAAARDFKQMPRTAQLDGIVTLNLFAQSLVTLDFAGKRVRIENGEVPKADGAEVLEFTSQGGIPRITMRFGDHETAAHIDTGNMLAPLIVPAAFAEKLTFIDEPRDAGRARTVSGEVEVRQGRCNETARIGRYNFPQPVVTFPTPADVVNVGSKFLSDFVITFDQKNSRLRLVRKDEKQ